ncbi:MAG: hypothetical protein KKG47_11335 [Proteobacteria bacterium]|nr:hypothetical protein [Pseudomonadota bacterium]MBU1739407.1 hypothetical protein [Pseudomonadota bacterium]
MAGSDEKGNELAAEEAVQLLKIEIMAQDWSLSSRRATGVGEALKVLHPFMKGRKGAIHIMGMARGALDHIVLHGREVRPEVMDFLKAALANIVTLYEDEGAGGGAREAELFHRTYDNFKKLKAMVAGRKKIR